MTKAPSIKNPECSPIIISINLSLHQRLRKHHRIVGVKNDKEDRYEMHISELSIASAHQFTVAEVNDTSTV